MAVIGKMNYLTIGSNTYEIEDANAAPKASPALTGIPTAPTASTGTNTTQIATTEFVQNAMAGAGAGTVTSVGISNATNGGLSVSGSPISSSGTITIGHSNVLTSAQTTQAVYPIKIDKNGHISGYGDAVTIPTKVSDLTNDSGFLTSYTDENVKQESISNSDTNMRPILFAGTINNTSTTTSSVYKSTSFNYQPSAGLMHVPNIQIGSISTSGYIQIAHTKLIGTVSDTAQTIITLPDATGTVALTSDIPNISDKIDTAGTGLSKSGTTLNHSNSVTAATTQALYPIKIDAQGHISAYGTAITSLPASDVYSWAKASTKPTYTASEVGAVATSAVGAASGVVPLNASSKIDSTYLPSYVDDVLEYNGTTNFPSTGETGKIYVDTSTNKTYRWGGTSYTEISQGSIVTVSRNLTSGTKSATITVDGTAYDIYSTNNDNTNYYHTTGSWSGLTYTATANGGADALALTLPTGTTATTVAVGNHAHGNITNGGDITATAPTIASGDQIIINDHSASKITNGPTFDGSTTTTALTPKGTWESFSKFSGSYDDLTNKPTIPTVPTNISAFTNDSGYITSADIPEGASAYTGTISAVGTAASAGTNNGFARGDHVHNITKTTIDTQLGTGSGTTKFYREDGTWATPAYTTNTDTKVSTAAVTSGTTYYPVVGSDTTSAATKYYDKTGIVYKGTNGTTSVVGSAQLTLGNSTASGTANNKQGQLIIYGSTAYAHTIQGAPTAARTITLPDKAGTVALTSDLSSFITDAGVTKITTTAGTHTAITNSTGAVSFNVPTKTSHLTNDSGFITSYTDENMKWTASTTSNTYYPLQSTSTATTSTANTLNSVSFYQYYNTAGGYRRLQLGNTTSYTSTGGAYGTIRLYGTGATYYGDLNPGTIGATSLSANRTWTLPDATGTIALTSNIPDVSGKIDTAGTGLSKSGTTLNHSNSVTAGTAGTSSATSGSTLAVPYVTYDAQGHITATGTHTHTISGFLTSSSTLDATKLSGTIPSGCYTDTNTTYTLSNALASHKFTSTLTAGGSGSGTSTATMEFVAGTGITLTDDTTNKKITIASSVTNTDEKVKLTSVTASGEYPLVLGPTSITSGSTYNTNYNASVTLNANTQSLKLKALRIYYNDNAMATISLNGYNGTATNNTPIIKFTSSTPNLSGGSDYYVIVRGLTTPSGNNYDDCIATKKYVDDSIPTVPSNIVNTITTTAGVHTAITSQTENVSFNVPTKTSHLTNDSGFITGYTETDPTVPSWAKAASKPSYTASEISGLTDFFYPVGSYYETSDTSFNPNTAWGGTWVLETEGQVHISGSTNGTYQVNGALTNTTDGGEATHTLVENELPKISGYWQSVNLNTITAGDHMTKEAYSSSSYTGFSSNSRAGSKVTMAFGNDEAHNNMQPYIIVNRWHRTA